MIGELVARFLVGGVAVTTFAALGDVFKPRTFAGLFSAAPSVAIATLALTLDSKGARYAAIEGHCMVFGAVAMGVYALACAWVVRVDKLSPWLGALVLWALWLVAALFLKMQMAPRL